MADKKISALPASTTPLAGTEVLPIVQGGTTKQVSVDNLTSGKTVGAATFRSADGTQSAPAYSFTSSTDSGMFFGAGYVQISTQNALYFLAGSSAIYLQFPTLVTGNLTASTGNLVIGTAGKGIDFSANTHAAGMTSELLDDYEEGTFTPADVSGAGLSFSNVVGFYTKVGQVVTCHIQFQYPATADGSQARISLPFIAINSTAPGGGVFYVNTAAGMSGAQPNVAGNQTYIILSNVLAGTAYLNSNASGSYFRGTIIYNTTA